MRYQFYILTDDRFWEDRTFEVPPGKSPEDIAKALALPRNVVMVFPVGEDSDCPDEYVSDEFMEGGS